MGHPVWTVFLVLVGFAPPLQPGPSCTDASVSFFHGLVCFFLVLRSTRQRSARGLPEFQVPLVAVCQGSRRTTKLRPTFGVVWYAAGPLPWPSTRRRLFPAEGTDALHNRAKLILLTICSGTQEISPLVFKPLRTLLQMDEASG